MSETPAHEVLNRNTRDQHPRRRPDPFGFAQEKLREGSQKQILLYAQHDNAERLHVGGTNLSWPDLL